MTAAELPLRYRVAEASAVFDAAVEDADELELVELVERAGWALLIAAEQSRRVSTLASSGRNHRGQFTRQPSR